MHVGHVEAVQKKTAGARGPLHWQGSFLVSFEIKLASGKILPEQYAESRREDGGLTAGEIRRDDCCGG